MADGFKIAKAWVEVVADTSGLKADLDAKLARDKSKVTVTPEVDGSGFKAKLQAVIDKGRDNVTVGVDADTAPADEKIDRTKARLDGLDGTAHLDADTGEADAKIDQTATRLDEVGGKTATPKVDLDNGSTREQIDADKEGLDTLGAKTARPKVDLEDGGFAGKIAADTAASNGFSMSMMKWPAVIGAAAMALPALPGLLAGAAAAGGTLALAFGGVTKALQASSKATTAQGQTSAQLAQTEFANSTAIVSAQQAVSDARTQAAHDAVTSAESIKNAEQGVAQAEQTAAQNVASAEQQLASAQYNERQAQQALTQARQDAVRQLQALHNAEKDTALAVRQARLDLQQAELNQQKIDKSSTATALQKKQAALAVAEAEQRLKEAEQARTKAAQDGQKADKQGVAGNPGVVAAKHALAQADQARAQAARNVALAEQAGARAIAAAAQQLSDAERNSSWQRAADAEHIATAQRNLRDTYKQQALAAAIAATSGTASASAFARDMAALSPAAQKFVNQLLGMKNSYHQLQATAQTALFPGLGKFLNGAKSLMPVVSGEIRTMAHLLGSAFAGAGKAMESSGVRREIKAVLDEGNKVVAILLPALGKLGSEFLKVGSKSGTAVTGLAHGIATIVSGIAGLVRGLGGGASAFGAIFRSLGIIIGGLGAPLGIIVSAIAKGFAPALQQIAPVVTTLANALAKMIAAIPPSVMALIVEAVVGIVTAVKLWTIAQAALNAVLDMNPFVAIAAGIVALTLIIIKYHKQIWDAIQAAWGKILDFLKQWWPLALGIVTGGLGLIIGAIIKYHTQIWNAIKDAWNNIYAFFKSIIDKITNFFTSSWNTIFTGVKSAWNNIHDWFQGWWNALVSWVGSKVDGFVSSLKNAWNTAWGDVKNFWGNIQSTIQNAWSTTANWVTGHIDTFLGDVKAKWQSLQSDAKQAWDRLENIFKAPVNFLIGTVYMGGIRKLWDDVVNAVGATGLDLPVVQTLSKGARLPGYGGGDKHPALLESGETVVSKEHSRMLAPVFKAAGVPGYAAGGTAGNAAPAGKAAAAGASSGGLLGEAEAIAKMVVAAGTGNIVAFTNAFDSVVSPMFGRGGAMGNYARLMVDAPTKLVTSVIKAAWDKITGAAQGGGSGSGGDIVSYARSWLGKIPYVFGGTSWKGDDCSGFTQAVYHHFGYNAPRTSEQQGAWVDKTGKPVAGGLAFFNSPAGGPPPGHVGIVTGANSMISQAGPEGALGPTMGSLAGRMFTGVPPGGFAPKGGKGGSPSQNKALARKMYPAWSSGEKWREWNYIVVHESDWDDTIKNPSGAFGIAQALGHGTAADRGTLSDSYGGYGLSHAQAKAANSGNAGDQITWMHDYMIDRYGSLKGAYDYKVAHGVYDGGGLLMPGRTIADNNTGHPERVISGQGGISVNFYGTQYPSPEQVRALKMELASAVGVSG